MWNGFHICDKRAAGFFLKIKNSKIYLANVLHTLYSTLYLSTVRVLAKWTITNSFQQAPREPAFLAILKSPLRAEDQWYFDGTDTWKGLEVLSNSSLLAALHWNSVQLWKRLPVGRLNCTACSDVAVATAFVSTPLPKVFLFCANRCALAFSEIARWRQCAKILVASHCKYWQVSQANPEPDTYSHFLWWDTG